MDADAVTQSRGTTASGALASAPGQRFGGDDGPGGLEIIYGFDDRRPTGTKISFSWLPPHQRGQDTGS